MATNVPATQQDSKPPAKTPQTRLGEYLGSAQMKARIAQALPKHLTAERMIRMAFTSVMKTPKLAECNMESVALSVLKASQIGVELNDRDAYLVPFKGECQLIVSYMGMIQLAYRSGIVRSISARAVHAKDVFEYEEGSNEHLKFHPYDGDDDPGPLTHAWAMVRLMNGGEKFVVLNKRDIMRRKAVSKNPGNWEKYPEAYWAKSAVRELAKWMPQVAELDMFHEAVRHDRDTEYGNEPLPTMVETAPPLTKAERIKQEAQRAAIEAQAEPVEPQDTEGAPQEIDISAGEPADGDQTEPDPDEPKPSAVDAWRKRIGFADNVTQINSIMDKIDLDNDLVVRERIDLKEECKARAKEIRAAKKS